jgi:hypothetical protein
MGDKNVRGENQAQRALLHTPDLMFHESTSLVVEDLKFLMSIGTNPYARLYCLHLLMSKNKRNS